MEQQIFLKEFNLLPPDAQREVIDFISFLYTRYNCAPKKSNDSLTADETFFGMWKDREDMQDSQKWLRKIRESQWTQRNE
ncbi:MAG TPA: DUF2281 domain-containing protein [Thermodesulfovibrionia bacterium]|nr:DUF2281 domain-containing protein [Thermodesulfovibrionia bacterium]